MAWTKSIKKVLLCFISFFFCTLLNELPRKGLIGLLAAGAVAYGACVVMQRRAVVTSMKYIMTVLEWAICALISVILGGFEYTRNKAIGVLLLSLMLYELIAFAQPYLAIMERWHNPYDDAESNV